MQQIKIHEVGVTKFRYNGLTYRNLERVKQERVIDFMSLHLSLVIKYIKLKINMNPLHSKANTYR